jgi:predicted xylose isomerase-like sugar epimerase
MLGNIDQIKYFLSSEYKGFFSFEPFGKDLAKNDNLSNEIERNINFIEERI